MLERELPVSDPASGLDGRLMQFLSRGRLEIGTRGQPSRASIRRITASQALPSLMAGTGNSPIAGRPPIEAIRSPAPAWQGAIKAGRVAYATELREGDQTRSVHDRRRKAGSAPATPSHQLLCSLDCRVRPPQPGSGLRCRQRRPSVFHQRHPCRVHASGRHDRVRTEGGTHAGVQMGQHRTRQHQGRHHRNLPRHQQQACPALPRRIRIPVQSTIADLAALIPTVLTWAAVRTTPMPYRLLKLAEVYA